MTTRRTRIAAGTLAGVLAGIVPAGAAFAAGGTTSSGSSGSTGSSGSASHVQCTPALFSQAQATVEQNLTKRATTLTSLVGDVNGTTGSHLTSSDKATLLNSLQNVEIPGIAALQQKVPGDTTCSQLAADAKSMVVDYRVYLVMAPQTHLTIGADTATAVVTKVTGLEPQIQQAINNAKAKGIDVAAAQAAFNDLQSQVSAAGNAVNGVASTVLAQTPAGSPGNEVVFTTAKSALQNARDDLKAARTDLQTIRSDLK